MATVAVEEPVCFLFHLRGVFFFVFHWRYWDRGFYELFNDWRFRNHGELGHLRLDGTKQIGLTMELCRFFSCVLMVLVGEISCGRHTGVLSAN